MRVDGIPYEQGNTHGSLHPIAVVLHRTYGGYAGSKGVAFDIDGLGFHFLIGKAEGRVVQLADTSQKCWHAKGGNDWSVGIEFEGINEDPLTDWQTATAARILLPVVRAHGIPLDYMPPSAGRKPPSPGVRNHRNVPGSDHDDYVSPEDWGRIVAAMGGNSPFEEDDMFSDQDRQQLEDLRAQVNRLLMERQQLPVYWAAAFLHNTHQRAWTDELGNLHRSVWREDGWDTETLASGCIPCQWATIIDGTRGDTRFGQFVEINALNPDGSWCRAVWTPTDGWRPAERVAA